MINNHSPFTDMGPGNQMQVIFNTQTGICGNILKDDVSAQGSKAPHFFNPIVEVDHPGQIHVDLLEQGLNSLFDLP